MDILISVGASEFSLDRLLKIIDELCEEKILDGSKIIAQIGDSSYSPRHYKCFKLIPREDYQYYMEKADVIISHAGTGSVIPPLKMGKKIIVFPRLKEYSEHIDNHQLELAEVFTTNGYTMCATNKDQMKSCIEHLNLFIPAKFESNSLKMNQLIIDFIENI